MNFQTRLQAAPTQVFATTAENVRHLFSSWPLLKNANIKESSPGSMIITWAERAVRVSVSQQKNIIQIHYINNDWAQVDIDPHAEFFAYDPKSVSRRKKNTADAIVKLQNDMAFDIALSEALQSMKKDG